MHVLDLVERILRKRPVAFVGEQDRYVLLNGTCGAGGFESIGQFNEDRNLPIKEYMSYDEMKLSALLSVSSKSYFINDGSRRNNGVKGTEGSFQKNGVIVGQVGTRFENPGKMEWQDCIITPDQNRRQDGYGENPGKKNCLLQEWSKLWDVPCFPAWDEVYRSGNKKYIPTKIKDVRLNEIVYKSRIKMPIEVLLYEAEQRGRETNKKVYLHVVGLGLGAWGLVECQAQHFVDSCGDVLTEKQFRNIAFIDFSWIPVTSCKSTKNNEKFPNTDIVIIFSKRSLHDPVPEGLLLVCNFAWDGNSLPGNEYWMGALSSSGDPAAACSSGVAELHNALINPQITSTNLHIATHEGIMHVSDYAKMWIEKT